MRDFLFRHTDVRLSFAGRDTNGIDRVDPKLGENLARAEKDSRPKVGHSLAEGLQTVDSICVPIMFDNGR